MTTRRAFLQIATAAATPVALGGIPGINPRTGHHIVLFEDSQPPAGAFALRAQSQGFATRAIRHGDITEAWLKSVRPAWERRPASIAGLTTPAALFCFEELAFARGLRVVFHAEHMLLPDGSAQHQVQRAGHSLTASTLQRAGSRWPQRLADSLAASRLPRMARPGPSLASLEPALPAGATLLTSWIIA
ncbi:MAG: hypothetical protein IT482_01810 [Gammaproteobacteria bacterium]|nr:hypothetical protein [Gammaproteobacteria bacterium]